MFEQIWSLGNSESPCFGIKSEKTTVWIVLLSLVQWSVTQCAIDKQAAHFYGLAQSTLSLEQWAVAQCAVDKQAAHFYGLAQSTSVYSHDFKVTYVTTWFQILF
jgi:hypothetical protein